MSINSPAIVTGLPAISSREGVFSYTRLLARAAADVADTPAPDRLGEFILRKFQGRVDG